MFEVRRDIDMGPRTLKRGQTISEDEVNRLAPGKFGALRRTGIIRPVGVTVREELKERKEARHGRLAQSNANGLKALRAGGSDE